MSWNNRLFKQDGKTGVVDKYGVGIKVDPFYFVGECYYDKDGNPELHSSTDHNHVTGDTPEDTKEAYKMIGEAFERPVIELAEDGTFKVIDLPTTDPEAKNG